MTKDNFKDKTGKQKHIVSTHNDITELPLKGLTASRIDLLYTLFFKCQGKGSEEVEIPFSEIRQLTGYKNTSNVKLREDLLNAGRTLITLFEEKFNYDKSTISLTTVFKSFDIGVNGNTSIKVAFNEDYTKYLNVGADGNFTRSVLETLCSLSYNSKGLYLMLCRFSNVKNRKKCWWRPTRQQMRDALLCKDGYTDRHIKSYVLPKVIEELTPYFPKLKIEEVRNSKKELTHYYCTYESNVELLPEKITETVFVPSYNETPYICTECGKHFYEIGKKDGSTFFGHRSGDISETSCNLTFTTKLQMSEKSVPLMEVGDKLVPSDRFKTKQEKDEAVDDFMKRQTEKKGAEQAQKELFDSMSVGLSMEDLLSLEETGDF